MLFYKNKAYYARTRNIFPGFQITILKPSPPSFPTPYYPVKNISFVFTLMSNIKLETLYSQRAQFVSDINHIL
jgi:hypothetical protein